MHLLFIFFTSILLLVGAPAGSADAGVDIGVSIGDEGLKEFHLMIGDYYRVPYREVIVVRERRIPDEEIPVVFFIARRARVAPAAIIDLRLRGRTWSDIIIHFHLSPEIFYVPVREVEGPPYGRAYGHYKNRPRKEWRRIVLEDDDVVNLVNLRLVSEYYHHSPEEIIKMRGGGRSFVVINDEIKKGGKEGKRGKEGNEEGERVFEGKERGKHKGKGKRDD